MFEKNKKLLVYGTLFLIVALGFFLRIYNIENAPPGVYPDEAVNGEDAVRAIETGNYQWFYHANNGREGLFMNLIAFCFKVFGISILTLKLPSIIFGTLTIFGTYLLTKELFKREKIALISSFLMAVSFWAINFSRISFRANMLPCVLVFIFYFLFRGLRTNKYLDFAIGGFIFGIGLHTYIAFRVTPLILVFLLISFILTRENFIKIYWKKILIFIFFAIISAFPMFYTFYTHPEYLESRSGSISILSPEVNRGNLPLTFAKSFGLSLAKYNFWGDQNWRHNYPPYPILDPLTGILFLIGFIYSIINFFKLTLVRFKDKIRNSDLDIHILLVVWFFILLIPEFMTAEGLPHALRSIGTMPAVIIFSGFALTHLMEKFWKNETYRKFATVFSLAILILIGAFNVIKYNFYWAKKLQTAQSFESNLIKISNYLKTLPKDKEIFIITGSMQRVPIKLFSDGATNISYFYSSEIDKISPKKRSDFEIISTEKGQEVTEFLLKKFPETKLEQKTDALGESFYVIK
jgi:4-amino-4-deoxy-L-arabinose transferase-like glycosyltransferase